jgi:hypothetical protein
VQHQPAWPISSVALILMVLASRSYSTLDASAIINLQA